MTFLKTLVSTLLLLLLPFFGHACGYAFISQCSDYVRISADGSTKDYTLADCTFRTPFQNHNFGTVAELNVDLAEIITWESCENEVSAAHLYYRVYPVGSMPGAFQDFALTHIVSQTSGTYRTKRRHSTTDLDVLSGLGGGSYVLEMYTQADVITSGSTVNAHLTTDNNGSYFQAYFTLEGGSTGGSLALNFTETNDVTCRNGNDGSTIVQTTDGTAPYSYAWSNGSLGSLAQNLQAGNHYVTVTDAAGAVGTASVTISQPSTLVPITNSVNASGQTATDGSATVGASGGTPPYTYLWSTGATTGTIANAAPGTYTVTVTDAHNCTATDAETVTFSATGPDGYCTAAGEIPWFDWLTNVEFSGIDNASQKAHYTDYTEQNAVVSTGESYPITLQNGFSWQTYDEYYRVWIDYNRNGIFEEPAEIAFSANADAPPLDTPGGEVTGTVQIPVTASIGTTRMRVTLKRNAYALPCESVANGETEDYSVTIMQGGPVVCSLNAAVLNLECNNGGTIDEPLDDTFGFGLTVSGTGTSTGWTTDIDGTSVSGAYGVQIPFGDLMIADGDLTFDITDGSDAECTTTVTVTAPDACSNGAECTLTAVISDINCNNNGSGANPDDDTFTFSLTVTGEETGSGWIAEFGGSTQTGEYGTATTFGPFPISQGVIDLDIRDADDVTCTTTASADAPPTCSAGNTADADCVSVSEFPWHDWISGVSFGDISNPSGKSPYSNFTASTTTLAAGETQEIILTAGFSWFTYDETWNVWIDWNADGIFDPNEESVFSLAVPAPPNGTLNAATTGEITVPAGTALGQKKMRVTLKRDAFAAPCEAIPMGEVEDYTVIVTAPGGNGRQSAGILRTEVNEVNEAADISFYGVLPTEIVNAEVQKSHDGETFFHLTERQTEDYGDNSITLRLQDFDLQKGYNYYRVKLTGSDGGTHYSNAQLLYFQPLPTFTISPNPAQDFVKVQMWEEVEGAVTWTIVNQFGQEIGRGVRENNAEKSLRIDTGYLRDGLYFLNVTAQGKRGKAGKFVIARL